MYLDRVLAMARRAPRGATSALIVKVAEEYVRRSVKGSETRRLDVIPWAEYVAPNAWVDAGARQRRQRQRRPR